MQAIQEKSYVPPPKPKQNSTRVNEPELMKRHRADVKFHHPFHKNSSEMHTIKEAVDEAEITDPKMLQPILDSLQVKTRKKHKPTPQENHIHVHRNSTIAKEEKKNFKIESPHFDQTKSEEALEDIIKRLQSLGNKTNSILDRINKKFGKNETDDTKFDVKGRHYSKPAVHFDENIDRARRRRQITISNAMKSNLTEDDEERNLAMEEVSAIL